MLLFQNKRGESLIEVVVSLGLITFIFVGTLSLLVSSINLNLSARQRNKAINLASNQLSAYYLYGAAATAMDSGLCVINPPRVATATAIDNPGCQTISLSGLMSAPEQMCSYIVLSNLDQSLEEVDVDPLKLINSSFYVKIESHVKYYVRGMDIQEFTITKLLRSQ